MIDDDRLTKCCVCCQCVTVWQVTQMHDYMANASIAHHTSLSRYIQLYELFHLATVFWLPWTFILVSDQRCCALVGAFTFPIIIIIITMNLIGRYATHELRIAYARF